MEPSNKTTPRVERLVGKFRLPGCLRQKGAERVAKIRKCLAGFKESRKGSASENSLGVKSRGSRGTGPKSKGCVSRSRLI